MARKRRIKALERELREVKQLLAQRLPVEEPDYDEMVARAMQLVPARARRGGQAHVPGAGREADALRSAAEALLPRRARRG